MKMCPHRDQKSGVAGVLFHCSPDLLPPRTPRSSPGSCTPPWKIPRPGPANHVAHRCSLGREAPTRGVCPKLTTSGPSLSSSGPPMRRPQEPCFFSTAFAPGRMAHVAPSPPWARPPDTTRHRPSYLPSPCPLSLCAASGKIPTDRGGWAGTGGFDLPCGGSAGDGVFILQITHSRPCVISGAVWGLGALSVCRHLGVRLQNLPGYSGPDTCSHCSFSRVPLAWSLQPPGMDIHSAARDSPCHQPAYTLHALYIHIRTSISVPGVPPNAVLCIQSQQRGTGRVPSARAQIPPSAFPYALYP